MRLGGSKSLLRLLVETLAGILILLLLLQMIACVPAQVGNREPEWDSNVYYVAVDPGSCNFIDGYGDSIPCDDVKRLNDFFLISTDEYKKIQEKFQRCEKWR